MRPRNPVFEISLVLIFSLLILTLHSFSGKELSVLNVAVKRPQIKEFLIKEAEPECIKEPVPANGKIAPKDSHDIKLPAALAHVFDSTPQNILMVGESMIEGLMFPFRKYAKFNGHTVTAKIWYGSRLLDWGGSDTLKKLIDLYKPTFIIVSIGSNELFIRNIDEREPFVKKIVEQLGNHKFIWVGPPNPKKDNGINDLIMRNVGEDRFFVSKYMHFTRKRDGVHPKADQCYRWADSISDWIVTKSRYPILLKKPVLDTKGNVVMPVQPGDTLKKPVVAIKPRRKFKASAAIKHAAVHIKNP